MALDSEIAKLAKFLEKDFKTAQLIADRLPVGDLSSMVQALDSGDYREVNKIYQKNKDIIKNIKLPDAQEVNDFYVNAIKDMVEPNPAEAKVLTADHFGIREEDVTTLIGESHDIRLSLGAYSIIKEAIDFAVKRDADGVRAKIMEMNAWQRNMFLYCVNAEAAKDFVNIERMGETGLNGLVQEGVASTLAEKHAYAMADCLVKCYCPVNVEANELTVDNDTIERDSGVVVEEAVETPSSASVLIESIVKKKF